MGVEALGAQNAVSQKGASSGADLPGNFESTVQALSNDPGLQDDNLADGTRAAARLANILDIAAKRAGINIDQMAANGEKFSQSDILAINREIRADPALLNAFKAAHGDDEGGTQTGFHSLQNNGGLFDLNGKDFADTVVDSAMHIGFEFDGKNFLNEDGDKNAALGEMTNYMNEVFFGDPANEVEVGKAEGKGGIGAAGGEQAEGTGTASSEKAGGTKAEAPIGGESPGGGQNAGGGEAASVGSELMDLLMQLFDKNGDGKLDEDEMRALMEFLSEADKNGDVNLSAEELKEAISAKAEQEGVELPADLSTQIEDFVSENDSLEADGLLSEDEIKAAFKDQAALQQPEMDLAA